MLMRKLRAFTLVAVLAAAMTLVMAVPAFAWSHYNCHTWASLTGDYDQLCGGVSGSQSYVVNVFSLTNESQQWHAANGHIQVWWCYGSGSPCYTIFNTPDNFYAANGGTNVYYYSGYWYRFPAGAYLYATFWERDIYTGNNWRKVVQTTINHF
jgi:hypothetical protein